MSRVHPNIVFFLVFLGLVSCGPGSSDISESTLLASDDPQCVEVKDLLTEAETKIYGDMIARFLKIILTARAKSLPEYIQAS